MQALEWCAIASCFAPDPQMKARGPRVKSAVVIGCGARHTAWQIGISETQRQAIYADPKWRKGNVDMK
jgi:homoserine acetyltransferase